MIFFIFCLQIRTLCVRKKRICQTLCTHCNLCLQFGQCRLTNGQCLVMCAGRHAAVLHNCIIRLLHRIVGCKARSVRQFVKNFGALQNGALPVSHVVRVDERNVPTRFTLQVSIRRKSGTGMKTGRTNGLLTHNALALVGHPKFGFAVHTLRHFFWCGSRTFTLQCPRWA